MEDIETLTSLDCLLERNEVMRRRIDVMEEEILRLRMVLERKEAEFVLLSVSSFFPTFKQNRCISLFIVLTRVQAGYRKGKVGP